MYSISGGIIFVITDQCSIKFSQLMAFCKEVRILISVTEVFFRSLKTDDRSFGIKFQLYHVMHLDGYHRKRKAN